MAMEIFKEKNKVKALIVPFVYLCQIPILSY